MNITLTPIGTMRAKNSHAVELLPAYARGLAGLTGFSHALIVWYADRSPAWEDQYLTIVKPYRLAPEKLGIFATRAPYRPNPICVSVAEIASIDVSRGRIAFTWADPEDGSPILDIKPYHPSSDRIRDAKTPDWCAHWPACYEESGSFAWDGEFLF
jgi:tRNA-Thr(GGU) m(6)t(6)A37 methyltransferase TsaA